MYFTWEQHYKKGLKFAAKIVVNIYYYKQKLASDEVRKPTVKCFLKKAKVKRKLIYREIVGKFYTSICFVWLQKF